MKNQMIVSEAEPFLFSGGKTGVLLVHGFTGTPREMRLLGNFLAEQRYTVLGIRLNGHATNISDIVRTHWQDWLISVEEGLHLLRSCTEQQVIVGLSMGGALSLIASAKYPVKGAVGISTPGSFSGDWRLKFLPILKYMVKGLPKGAPDWHEEQQGRKHYSYPYYPMISVAEFIAVLAEMQAQIPEITVPVILMQSTGDNTIPANSMEFIYSLLTTEDKQKIWFHNSNHMITMEPDRFEAFRLIHEFITRVTGS